MKILHRCSWHLSNNCQNLEATKIPILGEGCGCIQTTGCHWSLEGNGILNNGKTQRNLQSLLWSEQRLLEKRRDVLYGSNSVTFCKRLSCVSSETGDCQDLLRRRWQGEHEESGAGLCDNIGSRRHLQSISDCLFSLTQMMDFEWEVTWFYWLE